MQLTIELIPRNNWFVNLRSKLLPDQWDRLRRVVYRKANYRCEICGGVGSEWPVECHELWDYDDKEHIQRLVGLIALCPKCHMVKHIGLASIQNKLKAAKSHLAYVNCMTLQQVDAYIDSCSVLWHQRNNYKWSIDISWIFEQYKEFCDATNTNDQRGRT